MLKVSKNRLVSKEKYEHLKKMSDNNKIFNALAIDQRGSLKKMIAEHSSEPLGDQGIIDFKIEVSRELTKYASSILLDPEYGLEAAKARDNKAGLIVAYEKTGYDTSEPGRMADLLPNWSAKRISEIGGNAVKILLYYDVDEGNDINNQKKAFVERIGSECTAEDIPFFLEILTYDANIEDVKSKDYAKVKPHKVNEAMRLFSDERYGVDILKVEVPFNIKFVEGYADNDIVYTKNEALQYFKEQSEATHLPFIFLSAGVSAELFQETILLAKEAGSTFNGVLCGRATWSEAVEIFAINGKDSVREWLQSKGRKNIEELNRVVGESAKPWDLKIGIID